MSLEDKMVFLDKLTNQRVISAKHVGDIVFIPNSSAGSVINTQAEQKNLSKKRLMEPPVNQLDGTNAALDGAELPNLNDLGENKALFKRIKRKVYREI